MTQIDFYLLAEASTDGKERFACRLANKVYQKGHQVCLLTSNEAQTQKLDQLLWTFSAGSFVPHEIYKQENNINAPVVICHTEPPHSHHDVLISLIDNTSTFFSRFIRVAEIVANSHNERQQARERYRFYRDRGYALSTHEL